LTAGLPLWRWQKVLFAFCSSSFILLLKGHNMLHIHIHINGKGHHEVDPPRYTEDLRQAIRTVAEAGDTGYITHRNAPHPSITHRFQLDSQARIRFTSTYTA
jgi:hypothetical protein